MASWTCEYKELYFDMGLFNVSIFKFRLKPNDDQWLLLRSNAWPCPLPRILMHAVVWLGLKNLSLHIYYLLSSISASFGSFHFFFVILPFSSLWLSTFDSAYETCPSLSALLISILNLTIWKSVTPPRPFFVTFGQKKVVAKAKNTHFWRLRTSWLPPPFRNNS